MASTCSNSNNTPTSEELEDKSNEILVNSTAIVTYRGNALPVPFKKLDPETDLKIAPINWLKSSDLSPYSRIWHTSVGSPLNGCDILPRSFVMAHEYISCVNSVDVISDAEVVKKLLKMPMSQSQLSVAVHRVGSTLLVDDFDVHSQLSASADEWEWLRRFIINTICEELKKKGKRIVRPHNISSNARLEKNIFSKFLHHSLTTSSCKTPEDSSTTYVDEAEKEELEGIAKGSDVFRLASPTRVGPTSFSQEQMKYLPEAKPEEKRVVESPRSVLWQFEDIRMLIGTDLPIFGGGTHPVVSLRLHDSSKPINVLTGLDYWLDNLICNVPELVMCYHLDGIVQHYELFKTENIPKIESCKFSPFIIKNIAQNILSFLNSNCTKEGHTYWLFKAHEDDIVKLYDLTSLCGELDGGNEDGARVNEVSGGEVPPATDHSHNPFTVPVAVLMYRVAKNLLLKYNTDSKNQKVAATIHTLLKNCLKLLDSRQHQDLCMSAQFLLTHLNVPDSPDDWPTWCSESSSCMDTSSEEEGDGQEVTGSNSSLVELSPHQISSSVGHFCLPSVVKECRNAYQYHHISSSIEERCKAALKYISKGLQLSLLKRCSLAENSDHQNLPGSPHGIPHQSCIYAEERKKGVCQFDVLCVATGDENCQETTEYEHKGGTSDSDGRKASENEDVPGLVSATDSFSFNRLLTTTSDNYSLSSSYRHRIQSTLFLKASTVYYTLAEKHFHRQKYGRTLRCLKLCFRAIEAHHTLLPFCHETVGERALLWRSLKLCGDAHLMLATSQEQYQTIVEDMKFSAGEDNMIQDAISQYISTFGAFDSYFELSSNPERCYITALRAYNHAEGLIPFSESTVTAKKSGKSAKSKTMQQQKSTDQSMMQHDKLVKLHKRLGNVNNELAKLYMNELIAALDQDPNQSTHPKLVGVRDQSKLHFDAGLKCFEQVKDRPNTALLLSNMGRLMRVWAHCVSAIAKNNEAELIKEETIFYKKAVECYKRALSVLERSDSMSSEIWDIINWELSSTYFTMGQIRQDCTPASSIPREEVEKDVIDYLTKALKHCSFQESSTPPSLVPQREYRAATIHRRLASLYHQSYRNSELSNHIRSMAELHYSKAVSLLVPSESPIELLRLHLERVALVEVHITGLNYKLRAHQFKHGLSILIYVGSDVMPHCTSSDTLTASHRTELDSLLGIYISRLQFFLLELYRCLFKSSNSKSPLVEELKVNYIQSLSISSDSVVSESAHFSAFIAQCKTLLENLKF